jgi:hypothetical protein
MDNKKNNPVKKTINDILNYGKYKFNSSLFIKDIEKLDNITNDDINKLIEFTTARKSNSILSNINDKKNIEIFLKRTFLKQGFKASEKNIIDLILGLHKESHDKLEEILDIIKVDGELSKKIINALTKKQFDNIFKYVKNDIKTIDDLNVYFNNEKFIMEIFDLDPIKLDNFNELAGTETFNYTIENIIGTCRVYERIKKYYGNDKEKEKNEEENEEEDENNEDMKNINIKNILDNYVKRKQYNKLLDMIKKIKNLDKNKLYEKLIKDISIYEYSDFICIKYIMNIVLMMKDLDIIITEDKIIELIELIKIDIKNSYKIIGFLFAIKYIYDIEYTDNIINEIIIRDLDLSILYQITVLDYEKNKITIEMLEKIRIPIKFYIFKDVYIGKYNDELIEQLILLNYPIEAIKYVIQNGGNINEKICKLAIYKKRPDLLNLFIENKYIPSKRDLIGIYNINAYNMKIIKILCDNGLQIDEELYKYLEQMLLINFETIIESLNKKKDTTYNKKDIIFKFLLPYLKFDEKEELEKFKKSVLNDNTEYHINNYNIKKMIEKNDTIELNKLFESEKYDMIMFLLIKYNYIPTKEQLKNIKDIRILKFCLNN